MGLGQTTVRRSEGADVKEQRGEEESRDAEGFPNIGCLQGSRRSRWVCRWSYSKKPIEFQENEDAQQAKRTLIEERENADAPKKAGNEIDDIFSGKKRKEPEQTRQMLLEKRNPSQ
ncbi:hypothetical protein SADUNF_Sadunf18G0042000 [Salix dunnii]|uniref:Uncharacterized protein n=1 Tax=Salix dunnii TaxID=1413687 RepID=A0A835MM04_9ROSI|nr:hypothetical protein SADUNF_Sadunf18G0042000 [Salix dunnii]